MTIDEAERGAADRVLVVHDSRLGSTAGIARFIGEVLGERGLSVEVSPVETVRDLTPYRLVVIGGAIRYDRWLRGARRFVARHRSELAEREVALFLTCLAMTDADGDGALKADAYARAVSGLVPGVEASEVGRFAGVLDPSGAPLLTALLLRAISRATGVPRGDHRDWRAIREWAERLGERWSAAALDGTTPEVQH